MVLFTNDDVQKTLVVAVLWIEIIVDYLQHNHKILENQIFICLFILIMFDYKKTCGCGSG